MIRKLSSVAKLGDRDRAALAGLPATNKTLDPSSYLVREASRRSIARC